MTTTQVIRTSKYEVTITELSATQASASFRRDGVPDFALLLLESNGSGFIVDAEIQAVPLTEREAMQEEIWERQEENAVNRSTRFYPASAAPFDILVAHYQRRNLLDRIHLARHPESRRGDKTK